MSFSDAISRLDRAQIESAVYSAGPADVRRALARQNRSFDDLLALLSPASRAFAKEMAAESRRLTISHFGKNISLYAPLYLSNDCDNSCRYCGFRRSAALVRKTLSREEIAAEARYLKSRGFDNVLLLTGECPSKAGAGYVERAVKMLSGQFTFIGLEIFPATSLEYARLAAAGASGITVYQETYNEKLYARFHPSGAKSDYRGRLLVPETALAAGFRRAGIGALLGLDDWRVEAAYLAAHADYLSKKFWRAEITLSFPRIRECAADFAPPRPVSDGELASMIFALRMYLPRLGIILSTRESPAFRDSMTGWGVTMMSAESRTSPGGYAARERNLEQFETADTRSLDDVVKAIEKKGHCAVFKDWDGSFGPARYE